MEKRLKPTWTGLRKAPSKRKGSISIEKSSDVF